MRKPHIKFSIALILAFWFSTACRPVVSAQDESATAPGEVRHGIELYRQHKYADAANVLKRALKENKSDADAWYYLGLALIQDLKKLKDASRAFETAARLRPNSAAAH